LRQSSKTPALLQQISVEPGYKRVASAIEAQILAGRLKAGELLPTEGDLAVQLGVHRSTVREGIRSLENAGFVKRAAGKRLAISIPETSEICSVVTKALGLMKVSFMELWEMQMHLEPFAARLASQRINDKLAQALRENIEGLRQNINDDDYVLHSDAEFHHLITEAARNSALSLSAAPIGALMFSATVDLYETLPQARHRLLAAHEAIADAILSQDAATAELWMMRHIRDFHRAYEVAGFDMNDPITLDARALHYAGQTPIAQGQAQD